jgi:hypothetical protein
MLRAYSLGEPGGDGGDVVVVGGLVVVGRAVVVVVGGAVVVVVGGGGIVAVAMGTGAMPGGKVEPTTSSTVSTEDNPPEPVATEAASLVVDASATRWTMTAMAIANRQLNDFTTRVDRRALVRRTIP